MTTTLLKFALFFISCLGFSFISYKVLLRYVTNLGTKNNDTIRFKNEFKPTIGGLVFFIIFLISIFCSNIIFDQVNFSEYQYSGILAATSLAFLMGLADDAYNTIPWLKLLTQILCGLILVFTANDIALFSSPILNGFVTVFWTVLLMNSLNMLDNMDGITGSVSLIILIAIFVLMVINGSFPPLLSTVLIGVIASLIAFLFYNKPSAKIYMGDSGSQFLGIILSFLSIHFLWNFNIAPDYSTIYRNISLLLILFAVPLSDTTTVTINRIRKGYSPMKGGRDHTTHYLYYWGFSHIQVLLIFSTLTLLSAFILLWLSGIERWSIAHSIFAFIYCLTIFLLLFLPTVKIKTKKK